MNALRYVPIILAFAIAAGCASGGRVAVEVSPTPPPQVTPERVDCLDLQTFDVLARADRSEESVALAVAQLAPASHVGLVYKDGAGECWVVDAHPVCERRGEGPICTNALDDWMAGTMVIVALRHRGVTDAIRQRFESAVARVTATQPTFDVAATLDDEAKVACAVFAARVFAAAGLPLVDLGDGLPYLRVAQVRLEDPALTRLIRTFSRGDKMALFITERSFDLAMLVKLRERDRKAVTGPGELYRHASFDKIAIAIRADTPPLLDGLLRQVDCERTAVQSRPGALAEALAQCPWQRAIPTIVSLVRDAPAHARIHALFTWYANQATTYEMVLRALDELPAGGIQ